MACYTPLTVFYYQREIEFVKPGDHNLELPCGKCLGCKLDRCSDWALRCYHESTKYEKNVFVTLTFRENPTTCKVEYFQKFMKRLRKHCKKKGIPSPRYFHATEYGEKKQRPHHHAIIFNYMPDDLEIWKYKPTGSLYISKELEEIWGHGFVTVGAVTHDSAAYVAAYTIHKDTTRIHIERETGEILEPEKMTCSRNPSIGLDHFKKYHINYYEKEFIVNSKGRVQRIPRAYMKWLEREYTLREMLEAYDRKGQQCVEEMMKEEKRRKEMHDQLKMKREERAFERIGVKNNREMSYRALMLNQNEYKKKLDIDKAESILKSIRQFRRDFIEESVK